MFNKFVVSVFLVAAWPACSNGLRTAAMRQTAATQPAGQLSLQDRYQFVALDPADYGTRWCHDRLAQIYRSIYPNSPLVTPPVTFTAQLAQLTNQFANGAKVLGSYDPFPTARIGGRTLYYRKSLAQFDALPSDPLLTGEDPVSQFVYGSGPNDYINNFFEECWHLQAPEASGSAGSTSVFPGSGGNCNTRRSSWHVASAFPACSCCPP